MPATICYCGECELRRTFVNVGHPRLTVAAPRTNAPFMRMAARQAWVVGSWTHHKGRGCRMSCRVERGEIEGIVTVLRRKRGGHSPWAGAMSW